MANAINPKGRITLRTVHVGGNLVDVENLDLE